MVDRLVRVNLIVVILEIKEMLLYIFKDLSTQELVNHQQIGKDGLVALEPFEVQSFLCGGSIGWILLNHRSEKVQTLGRDKWPDVFKCTFSITLDVSPEHRIF